VCAPLLGSAAAANNAPSTRNTALVRALPDRATKLPLFGELAISSAAERKASATRSGRLAVDATSRRPESRFSVSPGSLTYAGGRVSLRWSSSNATRCTLSASPAFWSGPNPLRVRCRAKLTGTLPAAASAHRWRFTFTARNGKRKSVVRRTFALQAPPFVTSTNWAGYAINAGTPVTETSGRFTVPTLNCSDTTDASEAMWVGIGGDGASTGDLLQTGVESTCAGGTQVEAPAWWEEFPEYYSVNFQSMSVSPGDQIEASVYQASDGSWFTRLDDLSTGVSGVMHTGDGWGTILDSDPATWLDQEGDASIVSYSGGTSAEWIIEDYGDSNGNPVPFADFGTVAFNTLTTSLPSWSLTPSDAIGLGDSNGFLLGAPSAPSGNGFSVTYTG
jgi:hypothetical protein